MIRHSLQCNSLMFILSTSCTRPECRHYQLVDLQLVCCKNSSQNESRCCHLGVSLKAVLEYLVKFNLCLCYNHCIYNKKKRTDHVSYCTSGLGIFTSRKESENTAHDVMSMMCTLTSVYYRSQHKLCNYVSPSDRNLTQHPLSASILIRVHHSCQDIPN